MGTAIIPCPRIFQLHRIEPTAIEEIDEYPAKALACWLRHGYFPGAPATGSPGVSELRPGTAVQVSPAKSVLR